MSDDTNFPKSTRKLFPALRAEESNHPLVYFDNAATSLRSQPVIDAVVDCMAFKSANVHRSVHHLGDLATEAFESSRRIVAEFNGADTHEIVFVRNTTEALNLIAMGWPTDGVKITSWSEHHSNILPWQGNVRSLQPGPDGQLDLIGIERELDKGDVRLVAVSHVSNVLGCENEISSLATLCHAHNALLVVDAAQSVPHLPIDVFELDCDFLAFSGHKLGAPSGVGVLYGKSQYLDQIQWYQRGGSTVEQVHANDYTAKDTPWRLEAGTPAVESVVGLSAAISFLESLGMDRVGAYQRQLVHYATNQINDRLPQMKILGPVADSRSGPISMVRRNVSPHLLARALSDRYGICARSGFHCAQPLHEFLGVPASLRLSFYHYNTTAEIDFAVNAIDRLMTLNQ